MTKYCYVVNYGDRLLTESLQKTAVDYRSFKKQLLTPLSTPAYLKYPRQGCRWLALRGNDYALFHISTGLVIIVLLYKEGTKTRKGVNNIYLRSSR